MAFITIGTILGALGGGIAWINSQPDWLKLGIFLGGLGIDVGIESATGFGVVGSIINVAFGFAGIHLAMTSAEVFLLALVLPLIGIMLRLYH